jgi:hypothetical protein
MLAVKRVVDATFSARLTTRTSKEPTDGWRIGLKLSPRAGGRRGGVKCEMQF